MNASHCTEQNWNFLLANMTRGNILTFPPPTGTVCARFLKHQIDNSIVINIVADSFQFVIHGVIQQMN